MIIVLLPGTLAPFVMLHNKQMSVVLGGKLFGYVQLIGMIVCENFTSVLAFSE